MGGWGKESMTEGAQVNEKGILELGVGPECLPHLWGTVSVLVMLVADVIGTDKTSVWVAQASR